MPVQIFLGLESHPKLIFVLFCFFSVNDVEATTQRYSEKSVSQISD